MWVRWLATVRSPRNSAAATSLFVRPSATSEPHGARPASALPRACARRSRPSSAAPWSAQRVGTDGLECTTAASIASGAGRFWRLRRLTVPRARRARPGRTDRRRPRAGRPPAQGGPERTRSTLRARPRRGPGTASRGRAPTRARPAPRPFPRCREATASSSRPCSRRSSTRSGVHQRDSARASPVGAACRSAWSSQSRPRPGVRSRARPARSPPCAGGAEPNCASASSRARSECSRARSRSPRWTATTAIGKWSCGTSRPYWIEMSCARAAWAAASSRRPARRTRPRRGPTKHGRPAARRARATRRTRVRAARGRSRGSSVFTIACVASWTAGHRRSRSRGRARRSRGSPPRRARRGTSRARPGPRGPGPGARRLRAARRAPALSGVVDARPETGSPGEAAVDRRSKRRIALAASSASSRSAAESSAAASSARSTSACARPGRPPSRQVRLSRATGRESTRRRPDSRAQPRGPASGARPARGGRQAKSVLGELGRDRRRATPRRASTRRRPAAASRVRRFARGATCRARGADRREAPRAARGCSAARPEALGRAPSRTGGCAKRNYALVPRGTCAAKAGSSASDAIPRALEGATPGVVPSADGEGERVARGRREPGHRGDTEQIVEGLRRRGAAANGSTPAAERARPRARRTDSLRKCSWIRSKVWRAKGRVEPVEQHAVQRADARGPIRNRLNPPVGDRRAPARAAGLSAPTLRASSTKDPSSPPSLRSANASGSRRGLPIEPLDVVDRHDHNRLRPWRAAGARRARRRRAHGRRPASAEVHRAATLPSSARRLGTAR